MAGRNSSTGNQDLVQTSRDQVLGGVLGEHVAVRAVRVARNGEAIDVAAVGCLRNLTQIEEHGVPGRPADHH